MANVITWFEIPTTDIQRAAAFYTEIMGYEIQATDFQGEKMAFFKHVERGEVSGALVENAEVKAGADGPVIYFDGNEDLNVALNKVEAAGGKVLMPKMKVSDEIGYIAFFLDTEGNRLGLHSHK